MDEFVARTYMQELLNQAEAAQIAAHDLNAALAAPGASGIPRAFAATQLLLASGAMISKMLWPQPSRVQNDGSPLTEEQDKQCRATVERGRFLRRSLGIKSVQVLESRKVRNALEHFDDRLDRYFEAGHRNVFDRNVGPRERLVVVDGEVPLHLRLIDPEAGTVSVLDDEVVMQELFDAISDVRRRVSEWMNEVNERAATARRAAD